MAETQKQAAQFPDPFTLLWHWLNSLPIAISVMLALAILSALGTMIPQEHLAQVPVGQQFSSVLIERYGASRTDIIMMLGLHHIYYTWYFFALLLWLSVSAVICNITRFRRTMRLWRMPLEKSAAAYKSKRALLSDRATPEQAALLLADLRARRFRLREETGGDGARYVYGDAGFWKLWGLMILHVSILILLAGGIYGKSIGVEGMIRLADGEQKQLVANPGENKHPFVKPLLGGLKPLVYQLSQDRFRIDYDRRITIPEDIATHVPQELHDYYIHFVKDFVSRLTVTAERTGETKEQEVTVNHPLIIDKLNLYQSSYQQQGYLEVEVGGETKEYMLLPDQAIFIGADGCYVQSMGSLFSLSPADGFRAVDGVEIGTLAMAFCQPIKAGDLYIGGKLEGYLGPMTVITAGMPMGGMRDQQVITPERSIKLNLADGRVATVRMSKRVENFSVFSYKRDPGIPILYLGWIAMIIGITLALYIPYTQVRLRFTDSSAAVLLSGAGRKPQSVIYRRMHDILFSS